MSHIKLIIVYVILFIFDFELVFTQNLPYQQNETILTIIGVDSKNASVNMAVHIYYHNGEFVKSGEGSKVQFVLKEGIYDIIAQSTMTSQEYIKYNFNVEIGNKNKYKFVWTTSLIILLITNSNNEFAYYVVTIYKSGTDQKVFGPQTRDGTIYIKINEGVYDIEIWDEKTNTTQWIRNLKLIGNERFEKTIKFNY